MFTISAATPWVQAIPICGGTLASDSSVVSFYFSPVCPQPYMIPNQQCVQEKYICSGLSEIGTKFSRLGLCISKSTFLTMFFQDLVLLVFCLPICPWNPVTWLALHTLGLSIGVPVSFLHQGNLSFKTQLKGYLFWALPLRSSVREKNGMYLEQRNSDSSTAACFPAKEWSTGEGKTLWLGERGGTWCGPSEWVGFWQLKRRGPWHPVS